MMGELMGLNMKPIYELVANMFGRCTRAALSALFLGVVLTACADSRPEVASDYAAEGESCLERDCEPGLVCVGGQCVSQRDERDLGQADADRADLDEVGEDWGQTDLQEPSDVQQPGDLSELGDVHEEPDGVHDLEDAADLEDGDLEPPDPCEPSVCLEEGRTRCEVDQSGEAICLCDEGLIEVGDLCLDPICLSEDLRTGTTVIDMTPMAGVTDPIRDGFDPLLGGDEVRVIVEVERVAFDGAGDLVLRLTSRSLAIEVTNLRLNGLLIEPLFISEDTLEVALPEDLPARVSFDGVVDESANMVIIDSIVRGPGGCSLLGSASGARLHITGTIDPKYTPCSDLSQIRSLQISTRIPNKNTQVYGERNGTFAPVGSQYRILTQMTLCLQRTDDRSIALSGSADGTRPWTVDDHLLLEFFDGEPGMIGTERSSAWYTLSGLSSATRPMNLSDDNTPLEVFQVASLPGDYNGSLSASAFTFPTRVAVLDDLFPLGEQVWVRISGLDTGVVGHLSRLFIISSEHEQPFPECRTHQDCPSPSTTGGRSTSLTLRSGCIAGACDPVACSGPNDCPLGQRCLLDFCTDGCTEDEPCPAELICGGGRCVSLAEGGCRNWEDCPLGEVCLLGVCQEGCFHPVNQQEDYSDNDSNWSLCLREPEACPRCEDPNTRCWNNYCRDCEIDEHCATSEICADFICR